MGINEDSVIVLCNALARACPLDTYVNNCAIKQNSFLFFKEIAEPTDQRYIFEKLDVLYKHSICFNKRINQRNLINKKELACSKTTYLKWVSKTNIGVLTYELKKNGWIKSQNEFAKLFTFNCNSDFTVRWNPQMIEELSYLFYIMRERNIFTPMGSKGYFNYLENHIIGFNGELFAKNKIKKTNYYVNKDLNKYHATANTVNNIVELIKK